MTRRRLPSATLLVVATAIALVAGCGDDEEPRLVLDGSPRFASTAGVLEAVEDRTIVMRDGRSFVATDDFRSFSTYTLAIEPVRNRIGEYVQLGTDGDEVRWLAGIGALLTEEPPMAVYTGRLVRVDKLRRAVFADGTVLQLADGIEPPTPGPAILQAQINVKSDKVTALVPS